MTGELLSGVTRFINRVSPDPAIVLVKFNTNKNLPSGILFRSEIRLRKSVALFRSHGHQQPRARGNVFFPIPSLLNVRPTRALPPTGARSTGVRPSGTPGEGRLRRMPQGLRQNLS